MRTSSQIRKLWSPACQRDMTVLLLHSGARVRIASAAQEAFQAVDSVMQSAGYAPRVADTGGYNCRRITGGRGYSLHAFGIAVDYNWNSNPYRADNKLITDMPSTMVAAIKAIKTVGGVSVFRWGGDYQRVKDTMHFEVVASPRELGSGIDWSGLDVTDPDPDRAATWPVLKRGERGPSVRELQRRLTDAGHPCGQIDGIFGAATEKAVGNYQRSRALDVDGVVGLQTWTALLTEQPPTSAERSPVKVSQRETAKVEKRRATCKRGSRGKAVTQLQQRLAKLGFDCGPADGRFGPKTEAAVRDLQKARGLTVDGIVGPKTWSALLAG